MLGMFYLIRIGQKTQTYFLNNIYAKTFAVFKKIISYKALQ